MKTFLLFFICTTMSAQEFKIQIEGFTDFMVVECEGKLQDEIYNKTIVWVKYNFKNTEKVIQS